MIRLRMVPVAGALARSAFAGMLVAVLGAATSMLGAQGSMAAPPPTTGRTMSGHASADSAQSLVNFLTTVNRDEVRLARLALTRATNSNVRAYAERVLQDHSNTLSAWEMKVPSLSLTIPDSTKSSATRSGNPPLRSAAMVNGISEVRDTATVVRGGVGAAAIHSANVALLALLEQLSGAEFEALYITSEVEAHELVLKELDKHPTTYTALQTLLTEFRSMTLDHRAAARKLQAGS